MRLEPLNIGSIRKYISPELLNVIFNMISQHFKSTPSHSEIIESISKTVEFVYDNLHRFNAKNVSLCYVFCKEFHAKTSHFSLTQLLAKISSAEHVELATTCNQGKSVAKCACEIVPRDILRTKSDADA